MQREIVKKIPNGKLIRLKIDSDKAEAAAGTAGKITGIKITGDFFLHPEESIETIEKSIIDMPADSPAEDFAGKIHEALQVQGAAFIGVSPEDIAAAINEALK